jgi:hypothetical protein
LAVGLLAQGPAVLPRHPHALVPLLGEAGLVHHPDSLRVLQPGGHHFPQPVQHTLLVPGGLGQEALQHPGGGGHHLGKVLGVAALLALHQQGLQVLLTAFAPLLAAKGRGHLGVEGGETLPHLLEVLKVQPSTPWRPRRLARATLADPSSSL